MEPAAASHVSGQKRQYLLTEAVNASKSPKWVKDKQLLIVKLNLSVE